MVDGHIYHWKRHKGRDTRRDTRELCQFGLFVVVWQYRVLECDMQCVAKKMQYFSLTISPFTISDQDALWVIFDDKNGDLAREGYCTFAITGEFSSKTYF